MSLTYSQSYRSLLIAKDQSDAKAAVRRRVEHQNGFGKRFLPRYKTVNGKRYQLHATRGWKCIGRIAA